MRIIGVSTTGRPTGDYRTNRKLNSEQVAELRRLREEKGLSFKKLGEIFGVSDQNAWQIVRGKTWNREAVEFRQQATADDIEQVAPLVARGLSHYDIARELGVTRMSAYRAMKSCAQHKE